MSPLQNIYSPLFFRRGVTPVIVDDVAAGMSSRTGLAPFSRVANTPPAVPAVGLPEIVDLTAGPVTALAAKTIKVLIADDHPFVRSGIKQCINDSAGMAVIGEAGTAKGVFDFLRHSSCDVLVLDIGLPDQSGLEVLRILKKTQPTLPVLILTMYPEDQFSQFCLRAGAAGFLSKANASNHLVDAIRKVARGGPGAPPATEGELPPSSGLPPGLPHQELSAPQFQIFCQIASGKTRKAIATELGLSLKTLSAERVHILKTMRMTLDTEIVRYAFSHQLCS